MSYEDAMDYLKDQADAAEADYHAQAESEQRDREDIARLNARVAELEAALAEAREDAARWAYVRKHARDFRISARGKQRPRYSVHVSFTNYEYDTYDNIDAAIDAARVKP